MLSKIILPISSFLSLLTPVCSQGLPIELTVFAAMMSENSCRPPTLPITNQDEPEPEAVYLDEAIRVMSFNIRSDDDPGFPWANRKARVASMIRFHKADLIGLQEPCQKQLDDLSHALSEYQCFTGASLGENTRVHDPIFFRKSLFQMVSSGYFFLSPTPDLPSKGWNAKFPRAVSWVKLSNRKTGKEFYFFNTHFDYHSREARDESAHLLKKKIIEIAGTSAVIVAGDFNLFPDLGGKDTYKILTDQDTRLSLSDAQSIASFPHHGPTGTWSGFKEAGQPGIKPDYIFVSSLVKVYFHGVLGDSFDGQFPSDHLPVVADLIILQEII
ncbi:MAG: endonuclease/exonuclease/phosphatase family protein [Chlamydiota bacterium]